MDIDRFLATHDGVVSVAQARACGLSDAQIARRVARGEWLRRAPAVYFATAWNWTLAASVRVAAEWASPTGALLAITAAWWLGLGVDDPRPLTVALPRRRGGSPPPGLTVVERDATHSRVRHRGLWVVKTALTVLDAAAALGPDGQPFMDRALQRHVSLEELQQAHAQHLGRRGSAAAGRLLVRAADRAASEAERRMIALLRAAGITGWSVNLSVPLRDGRTALVDIAFAGVRFALEVDGWAYHVDRSRFVTDRTRKRGLVADGWVVAEVTWWELENAPDSVVDDIRRTLARLGHGVG